MHTGSKKDNKMNSFNEDPYFLLGLPSLMGKSPLNEILILHDISKF